MAYNPATPVTNTSDGRQRLASAMTGGAAYGGGPMTNGNMAMGGDMGSTPAASTPMAGGNMSMTGAGAVSGTAGAMTGAGAGTDINAGAGTAMGSTGTDPGSGTGSSASPPVQYGDYNTDGTWNPDLPARNMASMSTANATNNSNSVGHINDVGDIGSYGGAMDPATMKAGADAAYQRATEYFAPDFQHQQSDLENQLASQGFTRGSEGYTRALDDMQRQQDLARTNAALGAQGVGFSQANQLIQNALQTRAQDVATRGQNVDMRGQDRSVDAASQGASATMGAANAAASSANYRADLDSEVNLRNLGMQQDGQDFNQMMTLMGGARGGVNAPNFGAAAPVDVSGAYNIASNNANVAANRAASDRNGLYQLGGTILGGAVNNYFGGY